MHVLLPRVAVARPCAHGGAQMRPTQNVPLYGALVGHLQAFAGMAGTSGGACSEFSHVRISMAALEEKAQAVIERSFSVGRDGGHETVGQWTVQHGAPVRGAGEAERALAAAALTTVPGSEVAELLTLEADGLWCEAVRDVATPASHRSTQQRPLSAHAHARPSASTEAHARPCCLAHHPLPPPPAAAVTARYVHLTSSPCARRNG